MKLLSVLTLSVLCVPQPSVTRILMRLDIFTPPSHCNRVKSFFPLSEVITLHPSNGIQVVESIIQVSLLGFHGHWIVSEDTTSIVVYHCSVSVLTKLTHELHLLH